MNQCPKGHRFPDGLPECPVCARDNELKTMYDSSGGIVLPAISPSSTPINPLPFLKHNLDLSKTVLLRSKSSVSKTNLMGWFVLLDLEGFPVSSYQLFNRRMTIGRAKTNDIILADETVSGFHCSIEVQSGKFVIIDNGASNKTIVDGNPVDYCILEENALIQLGTSHFKIKYA